MPLPAFRRSPTDKKVAGLFGGLGASFGIDATYLRLGFILLALVTGVLPALIGYAIGWAITVEEDPRGGEPGEGTPSAT
jgi:phage shock protein C